ncbi:Alpha-L-arabinofuranosidase B, catalytic [uncultured Caudovirales phage]|uniref:Alpha-L-arabinofuranosidase B, catalytic n=1 Tax=uncultured Caudovirales phage TaxID=2100421 RepID=A0A6J5LCS8_9CAUD|nr:Alpha-L-arabinofuranosidase B, catalytic [uncultured Caudovirales phage]
MYKLLTILLLLTSVVNGQMVINASAPYRPLTQYVFLLDLYPTTGVAYSFRKLSSTYNGNCIRVRRSSDNTESNIGFFNNYLDTATLKTFVGANNGFITIWYDQSSGGYDVSQSTALAQPSIVVSGAINYTNKCVCAAMNGSSMYLKSTASFSSVATSISFASVLLNKRSTGIAGTYNYQWAIGSPATTGNKSFVSAAQSAFQDWSANSTLLFGNGYASSSNPRIITPANIFTDNTQNVWIGGINSTANFLKLNGSNVTASVNTTANVATAGGTVALGSDNSAGNFSSESFQEVIVWQSNQSANQTSILSNINSFYKVY